ncbi:zf-HC2 domain-containing protein [Corynebacterium hindlerae]|uniref:Zf-HC2 domain-containing protein n=1 Tax=Corynebacterium hindlerae TaxID=699041 RepID=A0A7G5FGN3_9CORY|nr:zf-HC2 domain-containing protein [Corynebacterium hindlerae]QMV85774.1 zf-HC2 domain-containing protein [Corynebacterium hindlerae]
MLTCDQVRAALSARVDGEDSPFDDDIVDAHLSGCPDCQAYYERITALNRMMAFQDASDIETETPPDLTAMILAGVEPVRRKQATRFALAEAIARVLLVVFGLIYVAWAVMLLTNVAALPVSGLPAGTLIATDDPLLAGLLFDAAAFRMAMAFGLFFAAWRLQSAAGLFPVFGALFTFSLGFGVRDLVLGFATAGDVWGIALMFATAVLVLLAWLTTLRTGTVDRMVRSVTATPQTDL